MPKNFFMNNIISELDKNRISQLYNDRFKQHGDSVVTVGWRSKEDQILRFEMLFRGHDLIGKTILDVGCGLGDLIFYLDDITNGDFHYIGMDISEELIFSAKQKHNRDNCNFVVGEIFDFDLNQKIDFAVESGALSYKIDNNQKYTEKVMEKMFNLSKEMCALNFLSLYVDYQLEKNYHYSPETIFKYAKTITPYVALFHDYPLWEFTVQLKKGK